MQCMRLTNFKSRIGKDSPQYTSERVSLANPSSHQGYTIGAMQDRDITSL